MRKILLLGALGAFFFSSTFAINHWLDVKEGGHWFWTAFLRYLYVILFLIVLIPIKDGHKVLTETFQCFFKNMAFWIVVGGIGFGIFYSFFCYAASFSPGWVFATTWQITILMTPLVIYILTGQFSFKGFVFLIFMFIGIVLVNIEEFSGFENISLRSVIPISIAAFCYPLGNTLCKYACEGKYAKRVSIQDYTIKNSVFSQILMMSLGAVPYFIVLGLTVQPGMPNASQGYSTAFIALSTGVIATGLFYQARFLAKDSAFELSAADGTQALTPPMALFWEWLVFAGAIPPFWSFIGLAITVTSILLFNFTFAGRSKSVEMAKQS